MKNDKYRLIQYYLEHYPEDAYSILIKYPAKDIAEIIRVIDITKSLPVIHTIPIFLLSEALKYLDLDFNVSLLNKVNSNLVSRILRKWRHDGRQKIVDELISKLDSYVRSRVMRLMSYKEGSVGSVMNPAPFSISPHLTIKETLAVLGKEKNRYSRYIYIVDFEKNLLGVIPFKDLFYSSNLDELTSKNMSKDVYTLSPSMKIETIYENKIWSRWDSLPVVDAANELLGVLRFEVLEEYLNDREPVNKDNDINLAGEAIADVLKIGIKSAVSLSSEVLGSRRER